MLESESIFDVLVVIALEAPRCWFDVVEVVTLLSVHDLVVREGLQRRVAGGDSTAIDLLSSVHNHVIGTALLSHDPPIILV